MPTSVRLPNDIEKRLTILAKTTGRSKAFYIREAIQEYLDDLEDIYMAKEVLERIRKGEEEIYTLEEVEREFGLAD
ncbi:MAG: CopG family transcriptional regulator [Desulfobacteraceae bacterium 4484_190.1]|nr:MAG: CopG family transcriptional regulator [Desulfobacteraceae bacterium 4484_190.1]